MRPPSVAPPRLQAEAEAAKKDATRLAGEREGETERAQKEGARARRLEEQLQARGCRGACLFAGAPENCAAVAG